MSFPTDFVTIRERPKNVLLNLCTMMECCSTKIQSHLPSVFSSRLRNFQYFLKFFPLSFSLSFSFFLHHNSLQMHQLHLKVTAIGDGCEPSRERSSENLFKLSFSTSFFPPPPLFSFSRTLKSKLDV